MHYLHQTTKADHKDILGRRAIHQNDTKPNAIWQKYWLTVTLNKILK
jgi:hypothetical protein